jgi:hypothetical protein
MADFTKRTVADMAADNPGMNMGTDSGPKRIDWDNVDAHWRDQYASRPYARADRAWDYYRPAYRYGTESAYQFDGRNWDDAENSLRAGWSETHADAHGTWEDVKDAVRDAWDRVRGKGEGDRGR